MALIGNACGLVAVALFIFSYQLFDKKKLLIVQTFATGMNCLQYLLLGAYSGLALNILAVIRNLIFSNRDNNKICGAKWMPYLLALMMGGISIFTWEGYYSLFIIVGLMINTVCLGICDSQSLRYSILVSCPLILTYDAFAGAYAGMLNEGISTVSAIVGIVRYIRASKLGKLNTGKK